jgi:hypothetical protein
MPEQTEDSKNLNMVVNAQFARKFKAYAAILDCNMPQLFQDTFDVLIDALPKVKDYDEYLERLKKSITSDQVVD